VRYRRSVREDFAYRDDAELNPHPPFCGAKRHLLPVSGEGWRAPEQRSVGAAKLSTLSQAWEKVVAEGFVQASATSRSSADSSSSEWMRN
jgi:hypothetical protein